MLFRSYPPPPPPPSLTPNPPPLVPGVPPESRMMYEMQDSNKAVGEQLLGKEDPLFRNVPRSKSKSVHRLSRLASVINTLCFQEMAIAGFQRLGAKAGFLIKVILAGESNRWISIQNDCCLQHTTRFENGKGFLVHFLRSPYCFSQERHEDSTVSVFPR